MWLTENKEIVYKTFFIAGSIALFMGLGNYAYTYNKKKYTDNSIYTNILNDTNVLNDTTDKVAEVIDNTK
jgi:hypothetical protein